MPKIRDILAYEVPTSTVIRLYPEGIFYKAYEFSAFYFHKYVRQYAIKKRYYKNIHSEVVSVGFPISIFCELRLPDGANTHADEKGQKVISLPLDDDSSDERLEQFESWKSQFKLDSIFRVGDETVRLASSPQLEALHQSVIDRICHFPLDRSTPLECLVFLSELRFELSRFYCRPKDN